MVSREEVVSAINKFIRSKNIKDAVILLNYLCDLKGLSRDKVKPLVNNPMLISNLIYNTIEELLNTLNINKITDKNNNLIIVF